MKYKATVLACDELLPSGRIYPSDVVSRAVEDAQQRISERRLLGYGDGRKLFDVSSPVIDNISLIVTGLYVEGKNVVAEIETLDTPMGRGFERGVKACSEHGKFPFVLSPAGAGCVDGDGKVSEYRIDGLVVVNEPDIEAKNVNA